MERVRDAVIVRDAQERDVEAISRIYVETWRATYRGILSDEYLQRLTVRNVAKTWVNELQRGNVVLVAEADGRVIAFSSGGTERKTDPFFRSEIFTLYVTPREQRRGVGALLFLHMIRRFADHMPVIVWVLEQNHDARGFYEALGGVPVRKKREKVGGTIVDEIAYAYFDVG